MDYVIDTAIDFLKTIKSEKIVKIKFTKKDGSERIMRCTLDFSVIPPNKRPHKLELEKIIKLMYQNNILRVFDVEKEDWRSVNFRNVDYLMIPDGKMYKVNLKK